jgi:hypothetical protein
MCSYWTSSHKKKQWQSEKKNISETTFVYSVTSFSLVFFSLNIYRHDVTHSSLSTIEEMTRKQKSHNEECCRQFVTVCVRVGLDVWSNSVNLIDLSVFRPASCVKKESVSQTLSDIFYFCFLFGGGVLDNDSSLRLNIKLKIEWRFSCLLLTGKREI